jgi:hypothetical protein
VILYYSGVHEFRVKLYISTTSLLHSDRGLNQMDVILINNTILHQKIIPNFSGLSLHVTVTRRSCVLSHVKHECITTTAETEVSGYQLSMMQSRDHA